jgi:hypothetical protein
MPAILQLLIGAAVIVLGWVHIKWRGVMHESYAEMQRTLGKLGSKVADSTTPNDLVFPALGSIFIGSIMVISALMRL